MKYRFTKHFEETLKSRYGVKLTEEVKKRLISNVDRTMSYKRSLKGREPKVLIYLGDVLYEYIAIAYSFKRRTFISALAIKGSR